MARSLFPGHRVAVLSDPLAQQGQGGLAEVLHLLTDALTLPLEAELADRAVEDAKSRRHTPIAQLIHAGEVVGLQIQHVSPRHTQDLLEEGLKHKAPPLISYLIDDQTQRPIWFSVGHRPGNRVRVRLMGRTQSVTTSRRRFVQWLRDQAHDAPWAVAEPSLPLETLGVPHEDGPTPRPLTRLVALLRTERRDLAVIVAFAVAVGILTLATPVAVQILINTVAFASLVQPIVVLSLLLLGVLGFAAALRAMQSWVVEILQRRIFVRVVADLSHRLPHVRVSAFDRTNGPGLVNRFFDVLTVQKAASSLLVDGLSAALQATVGLVLLSLYHPILLGFDFLLLLSIGFILFVLGRGAQRTAIVESKKKYAIAEWLETLAAHPTAFKHAGGEHFAMRQADELACAYLDARASHFRVVFRQHVGALTMQVISSALLLGIGGWLVIEGQLTLGQLVAAELIVTSALAAMTKFSNKLDELYDLIAAMDKLGQLVDLPLERMQGLHQPTSTGPTAITLRKLCYSHPLGSLIQGLNAEILPGERVAITSCAGGGKSTLGELVFGLREPTAGAVLIDGLDTRELLPRALREDMALVRHGEIFEATLLDNVTLGRPEITAEKARNALNAVGLEDMLQHLPEGLLTPLSPTGAPLSSSQISRVILARAIVARPRLIIIDQLLDSLAQHDREPCIDALLAPESPWTLLLLTADVELAALADRRIHLPAVT